MSLLSEADEIPHPGISSRATLAGVLGSPTGKALAGRTACLYGLGAIARPLAKMLRAFHVKLIGISRQVSEENGRQFHLSRHFRVEDREKAFAETDVLILCMR
jgi:phosphoglycerate dehydrogenase-like enzyme